MNEINNILIVSASLKVCWALVAVFAATLFSRWLDKRAGISFAQVIKELRRDPNAAAHYLGYRWLGIALIVGLVVALA